MRQLLAPLIAFTGGLLLGRFAPPPVLGWFGLLLTRETLWSMAIGCGVLLAVAAMLAPTGTPRHFIVSLGMGGMLFVPLLFVALVGTAALGEAVALAPDTLNTLSVLSPAPAYLIAALYVFWRAGRRHHA